MDSLDFIFSTCLVLREIDEFYTLECRLLDFILLSALCPKEMDELLVFEMMVHFSFGCLLNALVIDRL